MTRTVVILTFNEERHLNRCIASLAGSADRIVMADCIFTDVTPETSLAPKLRLGALCLEARGSCSPVWLCAGPCSGQRELARLR